MALLLYPSHFLPSHVQKMLNSMACPVNLQKENWPVTERQRLALGPAWRRRGGIGWESSSDSSSPSPAGPAPLWPPDPPAVDHGISGPGGIHGVKQLSTFPQLRIKVSLKDRMDRTFLFCRSSYPGLWVLAPLMSLCGPQKMVELPGLSLPVQEFSQATVQTWHTVLQLCTTLFCLKQGLHYLVTLREGW